MYPSLPLCLCLLLALQPALSGIYSDLATSLGSNYRYLSRDTNLSVTSPASSIRTQDFSEIFVWDNSTVFIGAENFILKIDANLDIETTYSIASSIDPCDPTPDIFLSTCENYFRVFLNINNSLYTCYTNRQANPVCVALNPTDLSPVSSPPLFTQGNSVPEGFISPTQPTLLYQRNFAIYVVDTNGTRRLVTGSVYDDSDRNRITVIDPFFVGTATSPYITTTFYYFEVPLEVEKFFYAASFARTAHNYLNSSNTNYIYFMFYEPSNKLISGLAKSRVGRFCLQGPSDRNSTLVTLLELPQMESFIKGELQCGSVFPSLVQDWLYVPDGSDYLYYAVFSSLAKGPQTSYLCIYSLDAISAEMDLIKECLGDVILETPNAFTPVSGGPSLGHVGGLFTQLQRYTFNFDSSSYEMIYVSLSNGSLIKYCLSCPTQFQLVHLMQVVPSQLINTSFPELNAIDRLQLSGDFLLAGGYTGLYRVPLQTCQALGESFRECLRDPMCYYNISSYLCEAVTAGSALSSLTLHFSQYTNISLPSVPSCSALTGTLSVSTVSENTTLSYNWTCVADFVTIVLSFSDGRDDVTYFHANNAGAQSDSLAYFLLNETLVSSFNIRPFFSINSVDRALPGPILYSYVTYNVTQPPPLPPVSSTCTPLPPICTPPVCSDASSCSDFCSQFNITCRLLSFACAHQILYTLNGGAETTVSNSSLISVSFSDCNNSCLFQAYSHNTTADTRTAGSSYWLHIILPLGQYTPMLSVRRLPGGNDTFSLSASFSEFSTHTCVTPTITTNPPNSSHTLQTCSGTFSAQGMIGIVYSKVATVEVSSSQQVMAPVSLQLNISKLSDINSCSFNADVTVSWQPPNYAITGDSLEYLIEGSACGVNSDAISVSDVDRHVCRGVRMSYNTLYSVSVSSYEPCHNKAFASSTVSEMTTQAPPSQLQGLFYKFFLDRLVFTWYPPICVNSNDPIQYHAITYRTPCDSSGSPQPYMDTTDTNTSSEIPITSTDNYIYTLSVRVVAGALESGIASLTVSTPVGREFNCQTCRVDRVTIDKSLSEISWKTTTGCAGLNVDRFNISLQRDTTMLNTTDVPGTVSSLQGGYSIYINIPGTYTVSVSLGLKHECTVVECVSSETRAFLFYSLPTGAPGAVGASDTLCQDEKAYIILGLAAVAIVCAVGNFGFMFVAFCVFCVPRKKVLCC